jgi:hypothetical protein
MKLFLFLLAFAFADETVQFAPSTRKLDLQSSTTIVHKDVQITALKGWSVGMNAQDTKSVKFEILLAPTKDLSTSDVFTALILRGTAPKSSLEDKKKKYESTKGYSVSYRTINGEKWLFAEHEVTHAKGFPYIETSGDLIKGGREFLLMAGYPKDKAAIYKGPIDTITNSVQVK